MTFPTYYLYEDLIRSRNTILMLLAMLILVGFMLWWLTRQRKPEWSIPTMWLIGVGGFYATLAALSIYYFFWASTR